MLKIQLLDNGSVVLGMEIQPNMVLPIVTFLTWADYTNFVTQSINFIELIYRREAMLLDIRNYISSLKELDKIGVQGQR